MNAAAAAPRPKISACLLSYNHSHTVGDAIASVLAQTWTDFELIIWDDASKDDSWEVINRQGVLDERIRAVRGETNLGMPGAANSAAAMSRGEYLAILHHDDVLDERLFDEWLAIAESEPRVTFVFNNYVVEDKWIGHSAESYPLRKLMDGTDLLRRRLLWRFDCPIRGTALIRRTSFENVNGFDERFGLLADVDLWMRLSLGSMVGYAEKPLIRVYDRKRPDYPAAYVSFTWQRIRLIMDIHAENVSRAYQPGLRRQAAFLRLRWRASWEVFRWIAYACWKGRVDILDGALNGVSPLELAPFSMLSRLVARGARAMWLALGRTP